MEIFYFIAAFLLIRRLQRSLKTSFLLYPKWKAILISASWLIVAIYIVNTIYFEDYVGDFIGSLLLLALIYFANKEPDFESQRTYLYANLPLAAIGFITGIVQRFFSNFYESKEQFFLYAIIAAFVWIFGRWAMSKKQSEELRISTERRAELEALVQERTVELLKQKEELQEIVKELKSTQNQLIQSEKMASLGELTAGIAHEIQNPLNFVNNFSEVSMELVDEMEEELNKGDTAEAIAIATDIKQNLEKIRHHGQRADGIVKGMLQHSRASSGQKEPTDINVLADEYLRLAYHGLRAKDKSFNADLVTHFDSTLQKANMVPQDVGRVLLNLFTNAFYAVQQKQKTLGQEFKPTVEVTTSTDKKFITVKVKDNGTGIPEHIKDKIMQPFFTTKPTGEGTGLGLSMSYDIVVKAHSGRIDINTKEGEYTEFVVKIPA
jgi:two-component system, NtrC family, sensor kinase